jgi:methyl-accepting chemotaxis protein
LALAANLVDISEAVANTRIGKTGYAMLLDDKGRLVAHGQPRRITALLQDLSDHPAFKDASNGKHMVYENNGKQVVAYSRKIRDGWTLIVEQDYAEAFAPLVEAERNSKSLLAATVALVVLAAWLLGYRLAAPIRRLTDVADRMSCGELDTEIREIQRGDEIGALARAIDRMGVSIRMAMQKLHKAAA